MSDSIASRVRSAGPEGPGVSLEETGLEITRFAGERNTEGLLELFNAFLEKEVEYSAGKSPDEVRDRCLGNLYTAAQLADCVKIAGGNIQVGLSVTFKQNPTLAGFATLFFRKVLDYNPPLPKEQ